MLRSRYFSTNLCQLSVNDTSMPQTTTHHLWQSLVVYHYLFLIWMNESDSVSKCGPYVVDNTLVNMIRYPDMTEVRVWMGQVCKRVYLVITTRACQCTNVQLGLTVMSTVCVIGMQNWIWAKFKAEFSLHSMSNFCHKISYLGREELIPRTFVRYIMFVNI